MLPGTVVLILALCLGLQPVTTDLYLPALPALSEGLQATVSRTQLTLSALLLAFGISQLIWGPLSDRFGRRPIMLAGLAVYALAAAGGATATSIEMLVLWRALQGAAMGAGVMCARAIIRDLYVPEMGARVMSKALSGLGVMACLSPPIGGLLAETLGWRSALFAPAVVGAAVLAVVFWRFEETVTVKNPNALQFGALWHNWVTIVRNPTFIAFTLLGTASYCVLFTMLASSPFVFIKIMGMSKALCGLAMFSVAFAYLCGTFLCRYWLPRHGVRKTLKRAGVMSLTGGTLLGGLALAGVFSPWAILLPAYLIVLAHGVNQPCSQSGAVGPFPRMAGAASALSGFAMMLGAFGMGAWLGATADGTVFPLTNGMWFWTAVIALITWTLVQKHGDPTPSPAKAA